MTDRGLPASTAAADLRRVFDESFAQPVRDPGEHLEDILCLRLGAEAYAVRVRDVRGLLADKKIVPLPSAVPELLGIIGRRGELVPVYDLRALLGYRGEAGAVRWIILAGGGPLVGFAFSHFEGQRSAPRSAATHTAASVDGPRHIIDLCAFIERFRTAAQGDSK